MKTLNFTFRGDSYFVNESGHIKANGLPVHSPSWLFHGGSRHHWSSGVAVTLTDAFRDPALLNDCLGWDRDHGAVRRWGGRYAGKLPRISNANVSTA